MKKKNLLLCLSLMMGTFFLSTTNVVAADKAHYETSMRRIPLEGEFRTCGTMRSIITPITAEQQDDTLFVRFQRTVGVVQVTITDEWGVSVFTETVNASMQPSLTISLMGLPTGNYVITFSNVNMKLRGEFEL
jgi:hypothetical protein